MSLWSTARSWVRSLLCRRQVENELDEELQFHVEYEIDQRRDEGLTTEAARQRAHQRPGDSPNRIKERIRDHVGLSTLDDLRRDVLYAARLLRRDPMFTVITACTMGVAVAAVVTVFSVVDAWLLKPLNFPHADRLAIGFAARPERPSEPAVFLPYRTFVAWQARSHSFATLAAGFPRDVVFTTNSEAQSLLGLAVSDDFFDVFGVAPYAGRSLDRRDANGSPRVVLSYGLWQRHFGGAAGVIGASIVLSGTPYEVIGVMPREFDTRVLDMRFEFWTPLRESDPGYRPGGAGPVAIVGRLHDGRSIAETAAEVSAITRDTESGYPTNFNRFVVNLVALQDDNTRTIRATLLTVSAAVLSLLVIASMNVGTLMLGRGMTRLREAAIRAAIGSGRGRLLRQFFAESAAIAAIGGMLGMVLATIAIRLFAVWNPLRAMPANDIALDARVLAAAAGAVGIAAVISGLVPAVRISGADPYDSLRSGGERGHASSPPQRAQAALLMSQIAVSVVLIVATTLMIRTFVRLQSAPLGFDANHLAVANVILPKDGFPSSTDRNAFYRDLAPRLRTVSGISGVAASTSAPLSSGPPVTVYTTPNNRPDAPRISAQEVTAEFFTTLRIPVIAGRTFDERDSELSAPVIVINDRAARDLFGDAAGAIGEHVRLDSEDAREVIGVVATVRSTFFNTLEWKVDPIVYRPAAQAFAALNNPTATSFSLKLHVRSDSGLTLSSLRSVVNAVNPRASVTELRTASSMIDDATSQPSFRMTMLSWFAAASVVLTAIGVYGLVAQSIIQRRRELAIRTALGATSTDLLRRVVHGALVTAFAGIVAGGVAAIALGRALEALLYGVNSRDVVSLAGAAVVLLIVAAGAAFVPALVATRHDPVTILRGD